MKASARVYNATRGCTIASKAFIAVTRRERIHGLMGRTRMEPGEALVIPRCRQVHTFGMRFAIDVAFVDRSWEVVGVSQSLKPRRLSTPARRARLAVELPAGTLNLTRTTTGDQLLILQ